MSAWQVIAAAVAGWLLTGVGVGLWLVVQSRRRRSDEALVREACELTVVEVDEHLRRQPLPPAPVLDGSRPSPRPRPEATCPCPGLPVDADEFAVRVEFKAITAGLGDVRATATQIEDLHRAGEDS